MARKHFDEYLSALYSQYKELTDNLKEYEEYISENAVDPDTLENFKAVLKPVADAYNSMMYVKYLLDMPNRKSKIPKYKKQSKKMYNSINSSQLGEQVLQNNRKILDSMKDQRL